jgi:transcriptional regulator GlxA family with amidase domain
LELSEGGRTEEAEQVGNVVAASPFISRYREWQETILEIEAKRKRPSMISVPSELNLKYRDARVQPAIDFMNANFHRKIALDEIAEVLNSSSSNFRHLFKKETGITPVEYLIRLRMKKARELLKTTFLSVKQVTAASGYNTKSHFTRHFKRQFGVTPSEYRKQFATRKQ